MPTPSPYFADKEPEYTGLPQTPIFDLGKIDTSTKTPYRNI